MSAVLGAVTAKFYPRFFAKDTVSPLSLDKEKNSFRFFTIRARTHRSFFFFFFSVKPHKPGAIEHDESA